MTVIFQSPSCERYVERRALLLRCLKLVLLLVDIENGKLLKQLRWAVSDSLLVLVSLEKTGRTHAEARRVSLLGGNRSCLFGFSIPSALFDGGNPGAPEGMPTSGGRPTKTFIASPLPRM